jgi:hypothetical protein
MGPFEDARVSALAVAFHAEAPQFKGEVLRAKRQKDLTVLVLRYHHGSIQLGGFLFVQREGELEALVKIITLRFEEEGIVVGVRPLFSAALEASWARAAPRLTRAMMLGLTPQHHEVVVSALAEREALAEQRSRDAQKAETQAEAMNLVTAAAAWQALLQRTPADAFCEHFGYLLDSPAQRPLLERVAAFATGVRVTNERLLFDFGPEAVLSGTAPTRDDFGTWPDSFRKVVAVHHHLSFPTEGWALVLGHIGAIPHRDALTDFSDCWIYEGTQLRLWSHEAGLARRTPLSVGALFLTRLAELLTDD